MSCKYCTYCTVQPAMRTEVAWRTKKRKRVAPPLPPLRPRNEGKRDEYRWRLCITNCIHQHHQRIFLLHCPMIPLLHCFIASLFHRFIASSLHRFIASSLHRFIASLLHCFIGPLVHCSIAPLLTAAADPNQPNRSGVSRRKALQPRRQVFWKEKKNYILFLSVCGPLIFHREITTEYVSSIQSTLSYRQRPQGHSIME